MRREARTRSDDLLHGGKAAVQGAVGLGCGERNGNSLSVPRSSGLRIQNRTAHAGPTAPMGCFSLLPQGSSHCPAPHRPLKKKKKNNNKGFGHPVIIHGSGRWVTWRAGLRERPASCPRPPPAPAQPQPRRSRRRPRRPRAGACAWQARPALSHFRRASGGAVPGRCSARRPAVGAGDADRRSREVPEAGLCPLPRERQVRGRGPEMPGGPSFSRWRRSAPDPRRGAVPGC